MSKKNVGGDTPTISFFSFAYFWPYKAFQKINTIGVRKNGNSIGTN